VAAAVYLVLSLLLFGRDAIVDPDAVCACVGDGDPTSFMWSFVWWPHAILDGLNPFFSKVVWAPQGANLTQGGFVMPAAGIALAPITLITGPVVAYNVASLLLPVLAAWFAYRLCRYLTGAFAPSLAGGAVFGFGTYMAAHLLGHLNLASIFLVPAAVHLVLLRLDEAISARRFVVLIGVVFAVQLLLSPEILVTGLAFGALALLLGYVAADRDGRRRIARLVPLVVGAGGIAMIVTSPYLYWTFSGLGEADSESWRNFTGAYTADALNVVVPTDVTAFGHWWFDGMASKFTLGTTSEATSYVGPILILVVIAAAIAGWRRPAIRVLVGVIAVSYVLSLGTKLHIAGRATEIPLPWALLHPLPLADHVIPSRLLLFGLLSIAIALALWLAEGSTRRGLRWAVALAGVALLIPNVSSDYWRGRPTNPSFFTNDAYKAHLQEDESILVLPYAGRGSSMLWQAEADMHFRMVGGYVSPEYPPAYRDDPFLPVLLSGEVDAAAVEGLRDFLVRRRVDAVIIEAAKAGGWPFALGGLGMKPLEVGGVLLYRVRGDLRVRRAG
jgi:hypothetical protein